MVLLTVFAGSFVPMLPVYARQAVHVGAQRLRRADAAVGVGAVIGAIVIGGTGQHRLPTAECRGLRQRHWRQAC